MIALEIQALSERRENLLIEMGRVVVASGFTLQRHRLAEDRHGVLLTMVVRGPDRKQRALAAALEAQERLISFRILRFEEGVQQPHFAASRTIAYEPAMPVPEPALEPTVIVASAVAGAPDVPRSRPDTVMLSRPAYQPEPETGFDAEADFIFAAAPATSPAHAQQTARAPAPPSPPAQPFVEWIPLGPDIDAVEKFLPKLMNDYPQIFPRLQKLEHSVAEAARASTLLLAGQRLGASVFVRDYPQLGRLGLPEAIERIGTPALGALVEVDQQIEQLHIHDSPICTDEGHSGCVFFSGFLEGLLAPALASNNVSIFSVCCRSFGAGECILAISD